MQIVGTGIKTTTLRCFLEALCREEGLNFEDLSEGLLVSGACLDGGALLFVSSNAGSVSSRSSSRSSAVKLPTVFSLSVSARSLKDSSASSFSLLNKDASVEVMSQNDELCHLRLCSQESTLDVLLVSSQQSKIEAAKSLLRWHHHSEDSPQPSSSCTPSEVSSTTTATSVSAAPAPAPSVPYLGFQPYILHDGEYRKISANSPAPVAFKNELFEGHALLMVRPPLSSSSSSSSRSSSTHRESVGADLDPQQHQHLYAERFAGNHYTFEVQVQGKFLKLPPGRVFIGAEITKPMSLGLLTKGMCRAILQLGRAVNKYMHHSFGDNQNTSLPHIVGPMWSSADRLVVSKGPDAVLPPLGKAFEENAISRATRRKNADFTLPVDLEATYSISFKTSNIDLIKWTVTNLPLVSNIDLHTFWSDAHLRTVCYCVRDEAGGAEVAAGDSSSVRQSMSSRTTTPYPKQHRQEDVDYLFCIEMQHESNQAEDTPATEEHSSATLLRPPSRERRHSTGQNYLSYALTTSGKEGRDEEDNDNDNEGENDEDHNEMTRENAGDLEEDQFFDALDGQTNLQSEQDTPSPRPESEINKPASPFRQTLADRPSIVLELSSFNNPHCVPAAIEVDETRVVRQSIGQKGRRTLYAFTISGLLEGKAHQCVLRTYNEWQKYFPIFKRAANRNSIRLSDTEKRRLDLETSFRIAVRDTKDDEAGRAKLVSFLLGGDHTASFLTQSLAGVGLGVSARRLRTDMNFKMESLVIVQAGNKFWSEEYMGLTHDELVFIKPPNRLGISSRLCLRFESILSVENVEEAFLPFCVSGCSALKISTFSREYVVMMRGVSFRNAWQNTIQISIEAQQLNNSARSRDDAHIDLLARPKCWKLGDRVILNARNFECASRVAVSSSPEMASLASLILESPHTLVAQLTCTALLLAGQYDSHEDVLVGGAEQSKYIAFMNGVSLLQRVSVSTITEGTTLDESICMFLNLYHCLLLHAMLVVGVPKHEVGWNSLYTSCGYEAFGDIFTLAELQQCVIQPGVFAVSDRDKYEFSLPAELTAKDPRLFFALSNGSFAQPSAVCVYEPASLSDQLDTAVRLSLQTQVSVVNVDGSNNVVIFVPKCCKPCVKSFEENYSHDAGTESPLMLFVVFLAAHCDDENVRERLLALTQQQGTSIAIKYLRNPDQYAFRFLSRL